MTLPVEGAHHRVGTEERQRNAEQGQLRTRRGEPGRRERSECDEHEHPARARIDMLAADDSDDDRAERDDRAESQTVTRSRSCSSFAGPMPRTRLRSSTVANGPCASRSLTIAA